jgi:hypothetical protein
MGPCSVPVPLVLIVVLAPDRQALAARRSSARLAEVPVNAGALGRGCTVVTDPTSVTQHVPNHCRGGVSLFGLRLHGTTAEPGGPWHEDERDEIQSGFKALRSHVQMIRFLSLLDSVLSTRIDDGLMHEMQ